jgi:hypothetical protein
VTDASSCAVAISAAQQQLRSLDRWSARTWWAST